MGVRFPGWGFWIGVSVVGVSGFCSVGRLCTLLCIGWSTSRLLAISTCAGLSGWFRLAPNVPLLNGCARLPWPLVWFHCLVEWGVIPRSRVARWAHLPGHLVRWVGVLPIRPSFLSLPFVLGLSGVWGIHQSLLWTHWGISLGVVGLFLVNPWIRPLLGVETVCQLVCLLSLQCRQFWSCSLVDVHASMLSSHSASLGTSRMWGSCGLFQ